MTLANCKDCGDLFIKTRSAYCPHCQQVHDRMYMQVRSYLRANPRSTVIEVHEKTGIPISKLLELRREDYFPFAR